MPKTKINEMSFVEKLKNYSKDMFDRLNDVDKSSSLDAPSSGDSDNDLKLSYQQYLILLQMLFVGSEAMVNRTRDIIEVNMNFIKNINVSDNGDVKTLTIDDKSWRAEKAKTAVMVTCTTNSEFIFIGKLFHLDNTEYEFVADGAEQIGQTEYKSASVIKSY